MRIARNIGLALALTLPAVAGAQAPREGFADSWFWGAKGGVTSFNAGGGRTSSPTIGAEWLITRSKGALYISAEQSFFDELGGVFDPSVAGSVRPVDIGDLRRYSFGVLAFPTTWGQVRPYAGLGLAISVIQDASPRGTFADEESQTAVYERVADQTSKVSAVLMAGAQIQKGRYAWFAQASSMPTRSNFLFSGAPYTFVLETGFRYNLASAIEKFQ